MVFSSITFLFYFLPIFLAALFHHPDDPGQKSRHASVLPGVLRLGRAAVHRRSSLLDRLQFPCGPGHRRSGRFGPQGARWRSRSREIFSSSGSSNTRISSPPIWPKLLAPLGLAVATTNIHLPLGISFFTFHCLSYVIDIYRRRFRANRDPIDVALYISLFPAIGRGTDRSLQDGRPPTGRAPVHARPRVGRRSHLHHRPRPEGAGGRRRRAARSGRVRPGSRIAPWSRRGSG